MEIKKTNCPYCGEEIEVGAMKCRYCGEWLVEHKENPIQMDEDAKVDNVATVANKTESRKNPSISSEDITTEKKPKWNIIIPVACLVIGLCAVGYSAYQHDRDAYHPTEYEYVDSLETDDDSYPVDEEDTTYEEPEDTSMYIYRPE